MYRSKLRPTTSSAAPSAPRQYRELDLCAGGAARSRLSGAPPFASVVAHASAMPDTGVARLGPDALELEPVWSPRVRTTPGEKRSCPGTYARLSPRRPCNECGPPRCFDECSDRQVSCGSPEPLVPRAKTRGFATVDDLSTIRLPARRVRLQRRPCVAACGEKPVLMETAGLVPRVFRLLALDHGLVFTTYSKTARREGPESARDAFRGPIGVPCVTPPSRRPSSSEPSARGSGREKKLRGADGAAVGRTKMARRRAGEAGATLLVDARAGASRRRADLIEGALHGADVKRRRRRRAGDDVRAAHGPRSIFAVRDAP